jgi:hypothetical protein
MFLRNEWRLILLVALFVGAAMIAVLSLHGRTPFVDALQFGALFPGLVVGAAFARAGIHSDGGTLSALLVAAVYLASFLFWTTVVLLIALLVRRRARRVT